VTDDELLAGLASALRREDRDIARFEVDPIAPGVIDAAALHMQRALASSSSEHLRRRRHLGRGVRWATSITAIAAAAALWIVWARIGSPRLSEPLPPYEVALLAGGTQAERSLPASDTTTAIRVRPGDMLDLLVRPATRVQGSIDARAFLVHDGTASPWNADVETTPQGSVRLRGVLGERAQLASATGILAIVVARKGSLPETPAELATDVQGGASRHAWQVVRVRLLAPKPP
jgi:hypothetical protein